MPSELQSMIAGKLDAVSLCNLKLVRKSVDTWTKNPPKMSASEWKQYHSIFETQARRRHRNLQTLACSGCMKLLDKGLFSDTAARHTLGKRVCISCAIQKGSYDKRKFKVDGKEVFGCRGCQKAKPLSEEDTCLVEDFPQISISEFLASRGTRWCHDCWSIVTNYRSLERSP